MTTATPTTHRQRYLRDALDELYSGVQQPTQHGRQAAIKVGSRTVSLENWEWETLVEWSAAPSSDPATRWRTLVVEALALQSRFHTDLERVARAPEVDATEIESARSDLHLDAVLAFRILAELQRETERMVVSGGMDQAKRLTQFRRRLNDCLTAGGKVLGETGLKEAEGIAGQAVSPAAPERIKPSDEREDKLQALFALEAQLLKREQVREFRPAEAAAATAPVEAPAPRRNAHLRIVLFAILGVALAGLVARTALDPKRAAVKHELDHASLAGLTAVRSVTSRPPSLFVVVDAPLWADLSASERLAVVDQVAKTSGEAGYTGAVIRTSAGAYVGQWLKSTGPRLLAPGT